MKGHHGWKHTRTPTSMGRAFWEFEEALKDVAFALVKSLGIIWLVKRVPFLQLRPWIQHREDGTIPPPRGGTW